MLTFLLLAAAAQPSAAPELPAFSPPPSPPPPPRYREPARPRAILQSYVAAADYPRAALLARAEGTVGVRLGVGPDGRVTSCTITGSSGSASLDGTTCRIMFSRARFTPAQDWSGHPMAATYATRIRWVLPPERGRDAEPGSARDPAG